MQSIHMLSAYCTFLRLVGGLASEKVRWAESVQKFKEEEKTLAGDVLLTASYLSYVGCFGRSYRIDMLEQQWLKFLSTQEVNCSVWLVYKILHELILVVVIPKLWMYR